MKLNVVLYQPKIPQNTGNIARTCAAVGARLHLIRPLGFSVRDRHLKRAGLDYWPLVDIVYHDTMDDFLDEQREMNLNFITKKASKTYDKIDFSGDIFLVFGKETYGLPEEILEKKPGAMLQDSDESRRQVPQFIQCRCHRHLRGLPANGIPIAAARWQRKPRLKNHPQIHP